MVIDITANGNSAAIELDTCGYIVGVQGTYNGATVALQMDVGHGYFPIKDNDGAVEFTADDAVLLPGGCKIRAVTSGGSSPVLKFYAYECKLI